MEIVVQTQEEKKHHSYLIILIKYMGIKNIHEERPHK